MHAKPEIAWTTDFSTFAARASERALVEASRCLTRKIAEGPPSKKANKKRPLRARRTRFTTLTSSLARPSASPDPERLYFSFFFLSLFFLYSSSLLPQHRLSLRRVFEDSNRDEFAKSSRNYFVRLDTFDGMCMLIASVNRTNETSKIDAHITRKRREDHITDEET